jgi:flagellar biosynthesis protein FlhB
MDILTKAPLYIIATNPYIVPNIPILFGKLPGDEYYSLIKYVFFFLIIGIITFAIFSLHNKTLSEDTSKNNDMKEIAKDWKTSLSDTVIMMFVVMLLYFLISVFIMPVQLIKNGI